MSSFCKCETPPFHHINFVREELGEDQYGTEVALEPYKECNRVWLVYLIEEPHYANSGRWWRVLITPSERKNFISMLARQFIGNKDWCYIGGSFYNSQSQKKPDKSLFVEKGLTYN